MDIKYKTLKQLLPELEPDQRSQFGDHLKQVLDVAIDPKIEEDGYKVRVYHEVLHDKIAIEAFKFFNQ